MAEHPAVDWKVLGSNPDNNEVMSLDLFYEIFADLATSKTNSKISKLISEKNNTSLISSAILSEFKPKRETFQDFLNTVFQNVTFRENFIFEPFFDSQIIVDTTVTDLFSSLLFSVVRVRGIIKRVYPVNPWMVCTKFICKKCNEVYLKPQNFFKMVKPICKNKCSQKFLEMDMSGSKYYDFQTIEIQDVLGGLLALLPIICLKPLCNKFTPGEELTFTGVLHQHLQNDLPFGTYFLILLFAESHKNSSELSTFDIQNFKAFSRQKNYFQLLQSRFLSDLEISPWKKSCLLLQLFKGVRKPLNTNVNLRGDIHILLIGDPGTSKSQILKNVSNITNCVYTSGIGSTAAGLTASVIKNEKLGQYCVEAGACVLSNGNMICIDELDKAREADISSLHEAMEQQTVSIAKAGSTMSLKSVCTVLAAANPKLGRFAHNLPLEKQLNFPVTLLSRFDLIIYFEDSVNELSDTQISTKILDLKSSSKNNAGDIDFVQKYVEYAKAYKPMLTKHSKKLITQFYLYLRTNVEGVTARKLESIVRLCEAKAKTRFSEYISVDDVNFAKDLFLKSLSDLRINLEAVETGSTISEKNLLRKILHEIGECTLGISLEDLADKLKLNIRQLEPKVLNLKQLGFVFEPSRNIYKII